MHVVQSECNIGGLQRRVLNLVVKQVSSTSSHKLCKHLRWQSRLCRRRRRAPCNARQRAQLDVLCDVDCADRRQRSTKHPQDSMVLQTHVYRCLSPELLLFRRRQQLACRRIADHLHRHSFPHPKQNGLIDDTSHHAT
jgi:hypothetical protein